MSAASQRGALPAFLFLISRTTRNRIVGQLARIKSPRYAFAMIAGIAYFWLVFFRPGAVGNSQPTGRGFAVIGPGAAILTLIAFAWWWLAGGVSGALAFQPAEVQMLFPAPVSRRGLIGYKVMRTQVILLVSALLWTVLSKRWGLSLAAPYRFVTIWLFFGVLGMHRLGVALVQMPPLTPGRRAVNLLGRLSALLALGTLLYGVGSAVVGGPALDFQQGIGAIGTALKSAPASWALAPFNLLVAPIHATTVPAWFAAAGILAAIVLIHLVWVLSMDVPFEEAAAIASAELAARLARFRAQRAGGAPVMAAAKVGRRRIPLAPIGRAEVALVWKNTLALIRTGALRSVIMIVVLVGIFGFVMGQVAGKTGRATAGVPFLVFGVMAFVMGPRMVRNDFRQDLPALPSLKTWPLKGSTLVAAELASPVLCLAGFQLLMALLAFFTLPGVRDKIDLATGVSTVVAAPLLLLGLNAVNVGIANAFALLFPAWVRLGPDTGGFEAMGQNLLVMFGSLLLLLLALLIPGAVGAGVFMLADEKVGGWGLLAGGLLTGALLLYEAGLLIGWMGRVFERMDTGALG